MYSTTSFCMVVDFGLIKLGIKPLIGEDEVKNGKQDYVKMYPGVFMYAI